MKIAMLKQRNDGIAVGGLCGRSGLVCACLALIQAVAIFSSCSKGGKSCEVFRDSAVRWTVGSRNLRSGADRPYGKKGWEFLPQIKKNGASVHGADLEQ